jgi:hypothetical protein
MHNHRFLFAYVVTRELVEINGGMDGTGMAYVSILDAFLPWSLFRLQSWGE